MEAKWLRTTMELVQIIAERRADLALHKGEAARIAAARLDAARKVRDYIGEHMIAFEGRERDDFNELMDDAALARIVGEREP
jgi:hypothetical protein